MQETANGRSTGRVDVFCHLAGTEHMDVPIIVAVIMAAAGLFASSLTFFLTKKKEREAEWRRQKLDHCKEFMAALNNIVGPPAPVEAREAHRMNTGPIPTRGDCRASLRWRSIVFA